MIISDVIAGTWCCTVSLGFREFVVCFIHICRSVLICCALFDLNCRRRLTLQSQDDPIRPYGRLPSLQRTRTSQVCAATSQSQGRYSIFKDFALWLQDNKNVILYRNSQFQGQTLITCSSFLCSISACESNCVFTCECVFLTLYLGLQPFLWKTMYRWVLTRSSGCTGGLLSSLIHQKVF